MTHTKAGQRNDEIKDHFVDDTEWFASRFIDFQQNSQLYHFATDFNRVLLQLVGTDIENSLFKYRVSYRHLTFMIESFELLMKSCKILICYPCIFNVQLHVHLKKWTLKFKLLYLRNYLCYFNKIRRIFCVNTHTKSLNVWLKFILLWLKYSIFSRGLFFIGAPCRMQHYHCRSVRSHVGFIGPILWGHSGPLCHALSLSLSWTSMHRRRATVVACDSSDTWWMAM